MTPLILLLVGMFLAGVGVGVAVGWWMRGEMWLAHQVTGKTMDFTKRKVGV